MLGKFPQQHVFAGQPQMGHVQLVGLVVRRLRALGEVDTLPAPQPVTLNCFLDQREVLNSND